MFYAFVDSVYFHKHPSEVGQYYCFIAMIEQLISSQLVSPWQNGDLKPKKKDKSHALPELLVTTESSHRPWFVMSIQWHQVDILIMKTPYTFHCKLEWKTSSLLVWKCDVGVWHLDFFCLWLRVSLALLTYPPPPALFFFPLWILSKGKAPASRMSKDKAASLERYPDAWKLSVQFVYSFLPLWNCKQIQW